jgi:uncharacterized protein (DUF1800 family)
MSRSECLNNVACELQRNERSKTTPTQNLPEVFEQAPSENTSTAATVAMQEQHENNQLLHPSTIAAGTLAAATMLTTGCSGGGGDAASVTDNDVPTLAETTVSMMSVRVTTSAATTVTISGSAAQANTDSTQHTIDLSLGVDGGEADPGINGQETVYSLDIATGDGDSTNIEVLLNATTRRMLDAFGDDWQQKHYLLERTGFGVRPDDLIRFADATYEEMVDTLVDELRQSPIQNDPEIMNQEVLSWAERRELSEPQRNAYNQAINDGVKEVQNWWYREMLHTPSPLTERMVVFWHGIWTSSVEGTPVPHLMWNQLQTMRKWGTKNFATMAHLISKDSAMVLYLDSDSNVKESPNENFARELMELFSLGEGQDYNEDDISEIARAFSGYGLDPQWNFSYQSERHDYGDKTYFNETHSFSSADESADGFTYIEGDYVIDRILEKNRCAEYLIERLWEEFIGSDPNTEEINRLAAILRDNAYKIAPVLRALFKSAYFRNSRGKRIKSPVEYLVGTYRRLGVEPERYDFLRWDAGHMGQQLYYPPSVRGWRKGVDWIDTEKYLERRRLISGHSWRIRNEIPERFQSALTELLLVRDPIGVIRTDTPSNTVRDLLLDTAYHIS